MKFWVIVSLVVMIDMVTKFIFESSRNTGGVFGVLAGWNWLFIILSVLVLVILFYYRTKVKNIGVALVFGGVLGNLIDRVVFGYVRDFIDLGFWPSFNIADSCITIGAVLLVIYFWER